jgi:hypothetical protein
MFKVSLDERLFQQTRQTSNERKENFAGGDFSGIEISGPSNPVNQRPCQLHKEDGKYIPESNLQG